MQQIWEADSDQKKNEHLDLDLDDFLARNTATACDIRGELLPFPCWVDRRPSEHQALSKADRTADRSDNCCWNGLENAADRV